MSKYHIVMLTHRSSN